MLAPPGRRRGVAFFAGEMSAEVSGRLFRNGEKVSFLS
jgi:hypothetical protein